MTPQRRNLPRDFTESSLRRKADATAAADVITRTATTSAAMARAMRADAATATDMKESATATARVTRAMRANATAMVKDTKESATATKTRLVK